MKRREFITLLGGAAATWPMTTHAQPDGRRRVGYLNAGGSAEDPETKARYAALIDGLAKLGWVVGKNLHVEQRTGATVEERNRYARELRDMKPDLLFASATTALASLREETRTPIVFAQVADPIGDPRIASLARPGGNVTGFTNFEFSIGGKWLQTLKEIAPATERVDVLLDGQDSQFREYLRSIEAAVPASSVTLRVRNVVDSVTIEAAIDGRNGLNSGLIVLPGPTTNGNREIIIGRAARFAIPAIYPYSYHARSGGLVSYGVDTIDAYRRAAGYVDRIFRGEQPGNLPIQQPTKFELVINLGTAKKLGLAIPPMLLARADEVIE